MFNLPVILNIRYKQALIISLGRLREGNMELSVNMLDNINFDQVRTDKKYDFVEQYKEFTNEINNPLNTMYGESQPKECKYYSPEDLGKLIQNKKLLKGALSTFHINCQSINAHLG